MIIKRRLIMTQEERVWEDPDKYRIDDDYEEIDPNEEGECGEKKRVQDLFCNKCQRVLQQSFVAVMKENFSRTELEYINEILDGEYIPDYVLGREEE
jgi:hypothetical protein